MKIFNFTLLMLILTISSQYSYSQDSKDDSQNTKKILLKTNKVLYKAVDKIKENKNFTGNLELAVRHQRIAIKSFRAGQFQNAIKHSLRARELASQTIIENKGVIPIEATATIEEKRLLNNNDLNSSTLDDEVRTQEHSYIPENLLADNPKALLIELE